MHRRHTSEEPHGRSSGWVLLLLLLTALVCTVLLALCVGKYPVTLRESIEVLVGQLTGVRGDWAEMTENVVLRLRLPRVLAAVIVGASLSISGATYQGLFRNPLISPDFLGVSSGACIGAALAILFSLSAVSIQFFAFCGGILAVSLTAALPKLLRRESNIFLVLSGIIVSGAMGSVMGLIKYVADPGSQLPAITYWQMGSLANAGFRVLWSTLLPFAVCTVLLVRLAWWINIVSLGERDARILGANVPVIRTIAIACATLLTAGAVSISGTIGWIGLVIPHFGRMIAGEDNRRLIPVSALLGGIFLLAVDTVGRTIGKAELPLSILTGLIGAPFYAWLLWRSKSKWT
ncbi:MAG: iron ABC transporter permease [Oscillospiraceae bacterium]